MRAPISLLALMLCIGYTMADEEPLKLDSLQAVSTSNAKFSNDLFKKFSEQKKGQNLISSPLSVHLVLSLLSQGAKGETATQMAKSLYLPEDSTVSRQGAKQLMDKLNNVPNVTLEIANRLYISDKFQLNAEYKHLASDVYNAEASALDFTKSADSANIINNWVDKKTHSKIKNIVKEEDITADSRMIVLNAIYFKGAWETAFKKERTEKRKFHIDDKTEKMVDTMFNEAEYFYGELPKHKAKFIELPYKNKNMKMVIIVPDEINGLNEVVKNLETVNEAINELRVQTKEYKQKVKLYLPKFKVETELDLKQPLAELGMKNMFDNTANFSGITNEPIKVDKAVQKAYIEINEEGSEAAAVTGFRAVFFSSIPLDEPEIVRVDKPFLIQIADEQSKSILFTGTIYDPK